MAPPHPLRRISTGSLSSLHRSQDRQHTSPSGLDFLSPALIDLSDEATTLAGNVEKLNELHDALGTFNESFAGWLYAMKMNAFCVEWPEVSWDVFARKCQHLRMLALHLVHNTDTRHRLKTRLSAQQIGKVRLFPARLLILNPH